MVISEKKITQRHQEPSPQDTGQTDFSAKSQWMYFIFVLIRLALRPCWTHHQCFQSSRDCRLLNASSRVVLQERVRLGTERCWAAPVPAVLQSWQRVQGRERHWGDCRGLHRGNTTIIANTCGGKKSKCLEEDVGQAQVPWEEESEGDDPPIPLLKAAQPITKGESTQVDRQTDRQTPLQPASAWEGGVLAPQGRWGEFQFLLYNKFLAFPYTF